MHATRATQFLYDIYTRRVESFAGAKACGLGELFIRDIHGGDHRSHFLGDLQPEVTEATDSEDGEALAWLDARVLQGAVDGNAGAEQWGGVRAGKCVGNFHSVGRGGFDKFSIATVHGYARNFLFDAEILIALAAEFAFAAGPVEPGDADAIAYVQRFDGGTFFDDAAGNFVAED